MLIIVFLIILCYLCFGWVSASWAFPDFLQALQIFLQALQKFLQAFCMFTIRRGGCFADLEFQRIFDDSVMEVAL